ncbi:MAG: diguanylate cyclase [Rhodoferax sp.]|nr:diguanylate cyclase [Rhodoferax sp.]
MTDSPAYLAVLDKLHTGVVIHAADTRILYINPRAIELLGLSREQMLGKKAIDPGWHFVDAEGRTIEADQYPVSRVITQRVPLPETVYGIVAPGRTSPMWVLVSAYPEYEAQGELQQIVVNFHDISAFKQAQETLRASEFRFRTLFETVVHGIVYQDREGHITDANPAAQRILRLSLDQLQGRSSTDPSWRAVRENGETYAGDKHPAMRALRSGQAVHGEVMGIAAPGRGLTWITVNASPLFEDGMVSGVYSIFEDVTEKRALEEQVRQQALFDPLTSLPNRHLLNDRIAQALAVCRRTGRLGALMVLDLDNFKPINDSHGHLLGDQLLQQVASRLAHAVRQADTVARFGGDEFVVLLPELAKDAAQSVALAMGVAEKIRASLAAPYLLRPQDHRGPAIEHHCSASIGGALFDPSSDEGAAILLRADQAMYEAKRNGRNRVSFGAESIDCLADPAPGARAAD